MSPLDWIPLGCMTATTGLAVAWVFWERANVGWALEGWNRCCAQYEAAQRKWQNSSEALREAGDGLLAEYDRLVAEHVALTAERAALAARLTRKPGVMAQKREDEQAIFAKLKREVAAGVVAPLAERG